MNSAVFEKARTFMYRNARPLDLARFQYHFENGSKEAVLNALSYYQNEDGGFGHAVEPDCWNPNSTPLHCSTAGEIIRETDCGGGKHAKDTSHSREASHPLIQGLLKWYASGDCFNGKTWEMVVESNNDHPHAPWWHAGSESSCHTDYNGTAQIAGFILLYAKPDSEVYRLGARIANEAMEALESSELTDDHTCACYVHLLECIVGAGAREKFPCEQLERRLHEAVRERITKDTSQWGGYVCRPSRFISSRDSVFYPENKELAEYECGHIARTQLADGSWDIPWGWADYPEAWAVSRNWWKGQVILENLLYLKGFGEI